jgi:hypothetical protein
MTSARRVSYVISIERTSDGCSAAIPELALACAGATEEEALRAVLAAEANTRALAASQDAELPVPGSRLDPLPRLSRATRRYSPFVVKVVAGYLIVVVLTGTALAIVLPTVRTRASRFASSPDLPAAMQHWLERAGVSACVTKR